LLHFVYYSTPRCSIVADFPAARRKGKNVQNVAGQKIFKKKKKKRGDDQIKEFGN
jgi:hypothetical protein